jgi:hypothetical protein
MLEHHAETAAGNPVGRLAGDVLAFEDDPAAARPFDAHDRLHRRRLA